MSCELEKVLVRDVGNWMEFRLSGFQSVQLIFFGDFNGAIGTGARDTFARKFGKSIRLLGVIQWSSIQGV